MLRNRVGTLISWNLEPGVAMREEMLDAGRLTVAVRVGPAGVGVPRAAWHSVLIMMSRCVLPDCQLGVLPLFCYRHPALFYAFISWSREETAPVIPASDTAIPNLSVDRSEILDSSSLVLSMLYGVRLFETCTSGKKVIFHAAFVFFSVCLLVSDSTQKLLIVS